MQIFKRKTAESPVEEVKKHSLCILDHTGHTEVLFDPNNAKEVEETRQKFDEIMAAQKGLAYTVDANGSSEIVKDFDPTAEATFVSQQLQGG